MFLFYFLDFYVDVIFFIILLWDFIWEQGYRQCIYLKLFYYYWSRVGF